MAPLCWSADLVLYGPADMSDLLLATRSPAPNIWLRTSSLTMMNSGTKSAASLYPILTLGEKNGITTSNRDCKKTPL